MNIVNLYENYNTYFNHDLKDSFKAIFEQCSKIAAEKNIKIYLIGGIVRDMLLNTESLDIDITVEGDAIGFCKLLEEKNIGKIISLHKPFGTAKIEIQGKKIDFASTRSESYPKSGHLPVVSEIGCSLKKDVLRRDFTINSLAISLNQENFCDLIDYVGGFNDLNARKIRVLHNKSFIDDPTRIIRALKYSTRLGFEIDKKTYELQKKYLKNVDYNMCNKRLKNELKKTFQQNSQKVYDRFIKEKIYKLVTPNKQFYCKNAEKLINKYAPKQPWLVYLGLIGVFESDGFLDKLELTNYEKAVIEGAKSLLGVDFKNDFQTYKAFGAQKIESLIILAVLGKKKEVAHYFDNLKKIKLLITGKDLLDIGIAPSKQYSEIFDYILEEKLKNPKLTKAEEIKMIKSK